MAVLADFLAKRVFISGAKDDLGGPGNNFSAPIVSSTLFTNENSSKKKLGAC